VRGGRSRALVPLAAALALCATASACRHGPAAPPPPRAGDGPAWRVLYGAGTRPRSGAASGPECRVQADGQQVCGHHCRTGRDGKVVCAATADGTCAVGTDGRARCTGPTPAPAR